MNKLSGCVAITIGSSRQDFSVCEMGAIIAAGRVQKLTVRNSSLRGIPFLPHLLSASEQERPPTLQKSQRVSRRWRVIGLWHSAAKPKLGFNSLPALQQFRRCDWSRQLWG